MDAVHFIARKLRGLARVIEKPELLKIRRQGVFLDVYEQLNLAWIKEKNISTLLDIGASVGDFALAAHAVFPNARIYAFEPLPDHFEILQKRLAATPGFQAFNVALGEQTGTTTFERSDCSNSSSILKMSAAHRAAFPETGKSQTTEVKIETLDNMAKKMEIRDPMLIKIDVQGYEDHVLKGGRQTLQRAEVIIVETSLEILYEGQPLFDDIFTLLKSWGFKYAGMFDQMLHPQSNRVLQVDAIFVR